MRADHFSIAFVCLAFCLTGCSPGSKKNNAAELKNNSANHYARRFSITAFTTQTLVCLFGNRTNADTTGCFVLTTRSVKDRFANGRMWIQVPCKRIAALSSIYASVFSELGNVDRLIAIDNIEYVNDRRVLNKYKDGSVAEVAKGPEPDIEKLLKLNPDIVFTYGMGNGTNAWEKKLVAAGIALAVTVDHLEEHPLARAEWIRFFGAFTGKQRQADSIFEQVEKNYQAIKKRFSDAQNKPTVFSELRYGDTWYMPGGRSFMASLLNDAGANYLWKSDENFGSLPLSFEQVFAKAQYADYWINLPMIKSRRQLLSLDPRYGEFKAFKEDHLYNNDRVANEKGYSTYWETGILHPDKILMDLTTIFHRDEKDTALNYYRKLP